MPLSPYKKALIASRRKQGTLETKSLEAISASIDKYIDEVLKYYRISANGRSTTVSERARLKILLRLRDQLDARLELAIASGVQTNANDVREIWDDAATSVAKLNGIVPNALLGGVSLPSIRELVAFESKAATGAGATSWKTVVKGNVNAAHEDVDEIIKYSITNSVGQDELSRRLRPYVQGSQDFHQAFGGQAFDKLRDLRKKLPPHLRQAAHQLRANADRIAISEINNARADAEVEGFMADPYVVAVKWERSPNRGISKGGRRSCSCDILATNNFYGLGPGIYPVKRVPAAPHPYCRCERVPVTVDEPVAMANKPNPPLKRNPANAVIPKMPSGTTHSGKGTPVPITAARAAALRAQTAEALTVGELGAR